MRGRQKLSVLTVLAGLLLIACGGAEQDPPATAGTPTPHGYVEGAEETAEPQARLVVAETGSGAVRVLDLLTEEVTELDPVPGVRDLTTDGRFAYLATDTATHVVDSGSWTVDHGDHAHYYRAEIRGVDTIEGRAIAAHTDSDATAVTIERGGTVVLSRTALEDGRVAPEATIDGLAVPYEQHLVVAADDGVTVRTREGDPAAQIAEPCREPAGTGVTRRGVVFGCAGGALLVSEDDGRFVGQAIPYPTEIPESERAREFSQRPGSATLAAPAGERGVWVLDVSERTWTLVETGPVVAVNAVGEDAALLTLTDDGTLHAYDPATGEQTATAPLLPGGVPDGASVSIQVDTNRAYINDPARQRIYEVDYNDDLRIARTFELGIAPSHMVETGR